MRTQSHSSRLSGDQSSMLTEGIFLCFRAAEEESNTSAIMTSNITKGAGRFLNTDQPRCLMCAALHLSRARGMLCASWLSGRGLTWKGFARFGLIKASATLPAHGIFTPRVLLTSDMSAVSRRRLTLPLTRPHTAVREKPSRPAAAARDVKHLDSELIWRCD